MTLLSFFVPKWLLNFLFSFFVQRQGLLFLFFKAAFFCEAALLLMSQT